MSRESRPPRGSAGRSPGVARGRDVGPRTAAGRVPAAAIATTGAHGSATRMALAVAAIVVTLHVLGAFETFGLRTQLWGTHAYGFLPSWVLFIALTAVVIAVTRALRAPAVAPHAPGRATWPNALLLPALFVAGAALCWLVRIQHPLLGDANSLRNSLAGGEQFHRDSPLALMLHHAALITFGGWFSGSPPDIAFQSVALESALVGGLFAVVAWPLAGEMLRARAPHDAAPAPALRGLVFGALCAQGYAQLFFGYVETYTVQALGLATFMWLALRCIEGRGALVWPGLALLVTCGFHVSSVALVPAFALLAALTARGRWARHGRDVALLAAALFALQWWLARAGDGYNLLMHPFEMARTAANGELQQGSASLFSYEHVRDFIACQLLIGPLGLLLTLFSLGAGIAAVRARDARTSWLFASAVLALAVSFMVRDLRLGYPRDWDLFAPLGIVSATFGVFALLQRAVRPDAGGIAAAGAPLAIVLAASLFATVPWIALNTSFERSFERFKSLPLRAGQREMLIGYWYGERGDRAAAHQWLDRALAADDNNTAAYLAQGYLYMSEARPMEAAQNFYYATRLRPSWWQYRVRLVDALMQGGEYRGALEEARPLIGKMPDGPRAGAILGATMYAAGGSRDSVRTLLAPQAGAAASDSAIVQVRTFTAAGDTAVRGLLGSRSWAWLVRD